MSLEWSNITECFSSPLEDLSVGNAKNTSWTDYDQVLVTNSGLTNNDNNDNNDPGLEIPNVALAEDAFRQVVNQEHQAEQENHYVYQQQYTLTDKGNCLDFSHQEGQPLDYSTLVPPESESNGQYAISSPKIIIKSDDIRKQLRNMGQSDQTSGLGLSQVPRNIPNKQGISQKNYQRVNSKMKQHRQIQNNHTVNQTVNHNMNPTVSPTVGPTMNPTVSPTSNMSSKEEENRWLIVLIIFVALFLLLSL